MMSKLGLALLTAISSGLFASCAIRSLYPLLLRYALATPNARSSHRAPTPQGAGIAIVAATLATGCVCLIWIPDQGPLPVAIFSATLVLAAVGFADDIKSLPITTRLGFQVLCIWTVIIASLGEMQIFPSLPLWIERIALLLAGVWFVNLVNFMDGLDWITLAEVVPVTTAIVILGLNGCVPTNLTTVAAALCGAMVGFAPFNKPVAKIFLGDVGSLPIGLLLGWFLLELAYHHAYASALLLPLYYLADTTITLARRLRRGEPIWVAHRTHFYQIATDNGFTVLRTVSEIFILNLFLATLAVANALLPNIPLSIASVLIGSMAVLFQLYRFSKPRPG